jgi:hypothetical protein
MSAFLQRKVRGHAMAVWLLWALGAAILLSAPMAIADPGVWMLVVDPELLALMIAIAFAAARIGVRLWAAQLMTALTGSVGRPARRPPRRDAGRPDQAGRRRPTRRG